MAVTLSIGIASASELDTAQVPSLLAVADACVYAAKHGVRNRLVAN